MLYPVGPKFADPDNMYTPQMNFISLMTPPAPLLSQFDDVPEVNTGTETAKSTHWFNSRQYLGPAADQPSHFRGFFPDVPENETKTVKFMFLQQLFCDVDSTAALRCNETYCTCIHRLKVRIQIIKNLRTLKRHKSWVLTQSS